MGAVAVVGHVEPVEDVGRLGGRLRLEGITVDLGGQPQARPPVGARALPFLLVEGGTGTGDVVGGHHARARDPGERRVGGIDAGIDHCPGDPLAVDVEELLSGVRLDRRTGHEHRRHHRPVRPHRRHGGPAELGCLIVRPLEQVGGAELVGLGEPVEHQQQPPGPPSLLARRGPGIPSSSGVGSRKTDSERAADSSASASSVL